MSIIYNGTNIDSIIYNGINLDKVVYNGVEVWTSGPKTYTQDEFISICNAGKQSTLKVGDIIKLNNSYCDTYEVIGVDHDNTTNTVDIMTSYQNQAMAFGSSEYYYRSSVRTWINGTYFNAFDSTIRNLSKYMSVVTNGSSTVNDHAKILSGTELGATQVYMATGEGNKYPAFEYNGHSPIKSALRPVGSYFIWLRSRIVAYANYIYVINGSGGIGQNDCPAIGGVLPVLRF